jgi:hypothetical protein
MYLGGAFVFPGIPYLSLIENNFLTLDKFIT